MELLLITVIFPVIDNAFAKPQHSTVPVSVESSYETDYYSWAQRQVDFIRNRTYDRVDWNNVAEEILAIAKKDTRQLESRLEVLLIHLLTVRCQPDYPNKSSWNSTIDTQRKRIRVLLEDNPSLKHFQDEELINAWQSITKSKAGIPAARLFVDSQGNIRARNLPCECPWDFEDVVGDHFYPDSVDEC